MEDDTRKIKSEAVGATLGDMTLEEGSSVEGTTMVNGINDEIATPHELKKSRSSTPITKHSVSQSPVKMQSGGDSSSSEGGHAELIGGDITLTVEPGKGPKLSRKATQKVASRPPQLFNDLQDAIEEALEVFHRIPDCMYGSKYMGSSEHDALDCDCSEEWRDGENHACGEDSDCINRATKMECVDGDCNCGIGCQNQRFQRRQYANVAVIKTEKKGYGLRANTDLSPGDFIFEYIGEVINEQTFRRRTIQYDQEGVKHFYFMSLTKSVFVDATKKGNLGRFCNHSCNPNCYVDKWVVGDKLRMGIFAERPIQKGEELVFNYNVDRYGADPQPCYCGEVNCTGFIGGKTQTERATKLSTATIEALGIDDGDGWDTAVAKKPRKKKTGEDDEEYVNNVQPRGLDEDGVRKVMATLMQCKEKWIAVKLLDRIQRCEDDKVRNRVVQMHGYQILRTTLTTWQEDNNVVLQILDILYKFPRLTKNKISDSKIEAAVAPLIDSEHEDVALESKRLVADWNTLQVAYRIPRKKWDPSAAGAYERRPVSREGEAVKSPARSPARTISAPTGPKLNNFQRSAFQPRTPLRRKFPPAALPSGWFEHQDNLGNKYYFSKAGASTWQRPTIPAVEPSPPKPIPKSVQTAKTLQDIIQSIVAAEPSSQTPTQSVPTAESTPKEKKKPAEKWRSLSEDKQKKLYENTLLPTIKDVMSQFSKSLSREDLKRFGKEVGKKLVESDFKNKRVEDPTKLSSKQEKKVRQYIKDFFRKVAERRKADADRKREKLKNSSSPKRDAKNTISPDDNGKAEMSPAEIGDQSCDTESPHVPAVSPSLPVDTPIDSPDVSKKRAHDEVGTPNSDSHKRLKEGEDESDAVPTPPPPPPPPAGEMGALDDAFEETEEEKELRLQEEELMRENEEAAMMDLDGAGLAPPIDVDKEMEVLVSRNKTAFERNAALDVNGVGLNNGDTHGNSYESDPMEGLEKKNHEMKEVMIH